MLGIGRSGWRGVCEASGFRGAKSEKWERLVVCYAYVYFALSVRRSFGPSVVFTFTDFKYGFI